jgi:hypothetical protein
MIVAAAKVNRVQDEKSAIRACHDRRVPASRLATAHGGSL